MNIFSKEYKIWKGDPSAINNIFSIIILLASTQVSAADQTSKIIYSLIVFFIILVGLKKGAVLSHGPKSSMFRNTFAVLLGLFVIAKMLAVQIDPTWFFFSQLVLAVSIAWSGYMEGLI